MECASGVLDLSPEGDYIDPIFTITGQAPAGNEIITMDTDFTINTLGYVAQIFTNLQNYVILILGLPLAFWGISKIISLFA